MRTALILALVVVMLCGLMVPQPAYAQLGPLSGITSILNTVSEPSRYSATRASEECGLPRQLFDMQTGPTQPP